MKKVDFKHWERTEEFRNFEGGDPIFSVTTPLDITRVYKYAKKHKISFYYSFGHLITRAMMKFDEFKIRKIGDEFFITDYDIVSFTSIRKNDTRLKFIGVKFLDDVVSFSNNGQKQAKIQENMSETFKENEGALAYFTCVPWFKTTQVVHPKSSDIYDFIPRFCWDKFENKFFKKYVNFNMQVNHMLFDGFLIARFLDEVKSLIKNLK